MVREIKIKIRSNNMKKTIFTLALVILVAFAATSCKKSSDTNTPGTQPTVEGINVGNIALKFTETDSQGNAISLESFKGKVIVLTFSAMWCGPCRAEVSELMNLYNTYKAQGLEIIQCVYQDEDGNPSDLTDLSRWMNEFGITFAVFSDSDRSTVDAWKFNAIPFNVVIDRDFIIKARVIGYDPGAIESHVKNAL